MKTSLYQSLLELDLSLCESFPAFTPLSLRREKAREVFNLIERLNSRPKKDNGQDEVIRRPAGDNWF